ncbi:unnamed protein product [Paramecium primaurelia]|uniref:MORN repeat protein n=1 Tax=Paramecium primaurelia TaxID=5886 RepID=A0A8S1N9M6_PARPR|nr:unnamed protein product [Paramecium primaurelia]
MEQFQECKCISLLKRDQFMYSDSNSELLNNFDQIKYLKFEGQYGQNNRKSGKWKTIWHGELLKGLGGYYENGLRVGLWNELIQNYQKQNCYLVKNSSLAQVHENGKYLNGQKYGMWKYIYKNRNIGGGLYNEQFKKNGKWIELSKGFCDMSQVTYKGEYQDGKKVGIWDILFLQELIGGGLYDNNGYKSEKWIEVNERFSGQSQIIYKGQYKNGTPVGIWETWNKREYMREFQKICGGQYDEGGEGKKIGKWIEFNDVLNEDSLVSYSGQYKNGNKAGRWDILFEEEEIGGGSYDEDGKGVKLGKWIEICDKYDKQTQVSYSGKYINGNKAGRWNILFEEEEIGGGSYDEEGKGVKLGQWIELDDEFWSESKLVYNGSYKNGNKIGRWNIEYEYEQIGGGSYDQEGEGLKVGKWIELSDSFNGCSEVAYVGEYKNGIKVSRWDIEYKGKKIGGGSYDERGEGIKIGNWVEVIDGFSLGSEITYEGQYKNGIKVGKWVEMNMRNNQQPKEKIYED